MRGPGGESPTASIAAELGEPSAILRERIALVIAELGEANARVLAQRAIHAATASRAGASATLASRRFFELATEALSPEARAKLAAHENQAADFRNQSTIPAPHSDRSRRTTGRSEPDAAERLSDFDGARISVLEAMAGLSSPDQRRLLARLLSEME